MTISPASVVFGLAAAAALGMAAKETICGDTASSIDELAAFEAARASASDEEAAEDIDDAAEAERVALEAARVALAQAVPRLAGSAVAQPGPLLAGIDFDVPGEATVGAWTRASEQLTPLGLSLSTSGQYVNRIVISDDGDHYVMTCVEANQAFEAAWGDGATTSPGDRVWWNDRTNHRVNLVTDVEALRCDITFDRALAGEAWAEHALAMGKLKTPLETLKASLTARHVDDFQLTDDDRYAWTDVGLGAGAARAHFTVSVADGLVDGMMVTVDTDEATAKAALTRVREHLGAPKTAEDDVAYWTGKKPASFEWDSESVTFGLGSLANGVLGE